MFLLHPLHQVFGRLQPALKGGAVHATSVGGVRTINDDSIDPAPAFMPLAKNPYRSDKLGDMGELAGLLKGSVVRGDNRDQPTTLSASRLRTRLARATTLSSLNVLTSCSKNTSLP